MLNGILYSCNQSKTRLNLLRIFFQDEMQMLLEMDIDLSDAWQKLNDLEPPMYPTYRSRN